MIACDLGSNTLRIVEFEYKNGTRVKEFEKIVKSAEGVKKSGLISTKAVDRIVEAIDEAKEIFDFNEDKVKGVATAAFRLAQNGELVLKEIEERTGVKFDLISPKEESELSLRAVEFRLKKLSMRSDSILVMDLGGGSTELIYKDVNGVISKSFDIGIVTAVEMGIGEIEMILTPIKDFLEHLPKRASIFVGNSGTPTTIASFLEGVRYSEYDYNKVNGKIISIEEMREVLKKLLEMDVEERKRWVGVGREELVIAGVELVLRIVRMAGFSEIIVVDDGVREGLVLKMCQESGFSATI